MKRRGGKYRKMTEFENLIHFGNSKRKIGSSYNQWTQTELCFITALTSALKSLNDFNKHKNNNRSLFIFFPLRAWRLSVFSRSQKYLTMVYCVNFLLLMCNILGTFTLLPKSFVFIKDKDVYLQKDVLYHIYIYGSDLQKHNYAM